MSIPKNKALLENAKELRKNMTRQERHLWYDFLRDYPVKIYKQKIIGNYIADFYCHSALLVIELDGSQHYMAEGADKDRKRTEVLEEMGIDVIRFSNREIDENFNGVCEKIDLVIKERGTSLITR